MGELLLVRHGQTEWAVSGRHTGLTDVELTEEGERQAARLAGILAERPVSHCFTSPLLRAARTAALAGFPEAVRDARLVEWDYGAYEGLTTEQINEMRGDAPPWSLWDEGVPPGKTPGESPAEVGARIDSFLSSLDLAAGDAVVFGHGHALRVLAARWLGLAPSRGAMLGLSPARVCVLGTEHGFAVLRLWNADPADPAIALQGPGGLPSRRHTA